MKTYKNAKQEIDSLKFTLGCTLCPLKPLYAEQIDLDHINPATKYKTSTGKRLSVSDMICARYSYSLIMIEAVKCQLLCKSCHTAKTIKERSAK
jgi:hypothetical protein